MAPEMVDVASGERRSVCVDCGETFAPAAARRDAALPVPERCPGCAARRRGERNARLLAAHAAGSAPRAPRTPPGPEDGSARLTPARCSECGRDIRLPFAPRADRPVFCRACWNARNGL